MFLCFCKIYKKTLVLESLFFKESCRPLACNFKKDFIFLWICKIFKNTFSMEITRVGTPFGGNYKSETGQKYQNITGISDNLVFCQFSDCCFFSMECSIVMLCFNCDRSNRKVKIVFLKFQNIGTDNFNLVKFLRNTYKGVYFFTKKETSKLLVKIFPTIYVP